MGVGYKHRSEYFRKQLNGYSAVANTHCAGPVGGAMGEFTPWRWVFWINIPICVIGIAGLIYALHLYQEISSLRSKMARIDYIRMSVFVASTTLLLYGITTGGTADPWRSASVLSPLIIGFSGSASSSLLSGKSQGSRWFPLGSFQIEQQTLDSSAFIQALVLWAFAYYMVIFVRSNPPLSE